MDKPPDSPLEGREEELEGMADPDVSQSPRSDRQGQDSSDTSLNIQDLDPAGICSQSDKLIYLYFEQVSCHKWAGL